LAAAASRRDANSHSLLFSSSTGYVSRLIPSVTEEPMAMNTSSMVAAASVVFTCTWMVRVVAVAATVMSSVNSS
jgi:hypothetical protein